MTEVETEATDHGHHDPELPPMLDDPSDESIANGTGCKIRSRLRDNFEYTHLYMIENVCIIQTILY